VRDRALLREVSGQDTSRSCAALQAFPAVGAWWWSLVYPGKVPAWSRAVPE